jgi:hypothetical protein
LPWAVASVGPLWSPHPLYLLYLSIHDVGDECHPRLDVPGISEDLGQLWRCFSYRNSTICHCTLQNHIFSAVPFLAERLDGLHAARQTLDGWNRCILSGQGISEVYVALVPLFPVVHVKLAGDHAQLLRITKCPVGRFAKPCTFITLFPPSRFSDFAQAILVHA